MTLVGDLLYAENDSAVVYDNLVLANRVGSLVINDTSISPYWGQNAAAPLTDADDIFAVTE